MTQSKPSKPKKPNAYTQPTFFRRGEDLPLISGTAPRAVIAPFIPQPPPPKQLPLPGDGDPPAIP